MSGFVGRLNALTSRPAFHRTVLVLIVANAVFMGLETSAAVMARAGDLLLALNTVVQALFVVEIALRVGACGRRPSDFFRRGWNVFDFAVVAVSLMPAAGPAANVARLARILRAARLVSVLPELRLIVGTMLRSIPSMGHVVALLWLLLYVYGILGFHFFGADAPQHWGSLAAAFQSLFQILTLEGWVEMQQAVQPRHPWSWLFFSSFIVIAVFVVINLFIAVVINNLETTRREEEERRNRESEDETSRIIAELRHQLDRLERSVRHPGGNPRPGPGARPRSPEPDRS